MQVVARVRCPECNGVNCIAHKTKGNLRHYHCRAGCMGDDGRAFSFKVRMI